MGVACRNWRFADWSVRRAGGGRLGDRLSLRGRKAAILWNIFGLADLAVAIILGMIIAPGPFQLIVPVGPSIGLDGYPNVLTPAFVVPGSILLHALSLRQLRRRSRAETPGR